MRQGLLSLGPCISQRSNSCPELVRHPRTAGSLMSGTASKAIASALNRPNICTVHEVGQDGVRPLIGTELL